VPPAQANCEDSRLRCPVEHRSTALMSRPTVDAKPLSVVLPRSWRRVIPPLRKTLFAQSVSKSTHCVNFDITNGHDRGPTGPSRQPRLPRNFLHPHGLILFKQGWGAVQGNLHNYGKRIAYNFHKCR